MPGTALRIAGRLAACLTIAGLLTSGAPAAVARGGDVFDNLLGSWRGSGAITSTNGQQERIRCRVTYGGGGGSLSQNLVCASASFRFSVSATIQRSAGGHINGTWQETSRGVGGNVSGVVRGNQILTTVIGSGFSASLSIVSSGNMQSVGIQTHGGDIARVAISFHR